jgi:hypothetical protein
MAPPAGAGTEGRPARRRGTGTGTGTSPGRTKVWVEPPGKSHGHHHHQAPSPPPPKRVAVVYYLCRNRHLEHPHFIEVPLAVPEEGLYLRGQSLKPSLPPSIKGAASRFRCGRWGSNKFAINSLAVRSYGQQLSS